MDPVAAKYIGAGIACIGMGGAGAGVGIIFGNYLAAAVRKHVPGADIEIAPGLDYIDSGVNYAGVLDNSRAKEDLGFVPRFNLDSAVGDYIEKMKLLGLPPYNR